MGCQERKEEQKLLCACGKQFRLQIWNNINQDKQTRSLLFFHFDIDIDKDVSESLLRCR